MERKSKEILINRTREGTSSSPSRGLIVLNVTPPRWSSWKKDPAAAAHINNINQNYDNMFVYNFFTEDERDKYSYENPNFDFSELYNTLGIDGRLIQKAGEESNRITSGYLPSFIRLSWDNSNVWSSDNVASYLTIKDFKIISGLIESGRFITGETNIYNASNTSIPIRGSKNSNQSASFEMHQQDWLNISNEYLDMFSDLGFLSMPIGNPWFVEEADGSNTKNRLDFLRNQVIGTQDTNYKNFLRVGEISDENPAINPMASASELGAPDVTSIAIPTTEDSAMLERVEYPEEFESPDITVILNSEHALDISRASFKTSGKILSTQSRIRNFRHMLEYSRTTTEKPEDWVSPLQQVLNQGTYFKETSFISENGDLYDVGQLSKFRLAGFVIEKEETYSERINGEFENVSRKYPLIFIPCSRSSDNSNPEIPNTYLDAAVNYGSEYRYSIRSVFTFSLCFKRPGSNAVIKRDYLVNSSYSESIQISCLESTPPPPPRDFSAFFDFTRANRFSQGKLNLTWAFPQNKQRDTAGFAIFSRKSIYEPFQLKKILDFNFSIKENSQRINNFKIKLSTPGDWDATSLVRHLSKGDSFTNYLDEDFELDTDYIYTICSLDAHGQISNYGAQLLINFDSRLSRLSLEQISPPGAPLVFPNWFLKSKAFQDVARISKYKKAVLKFRPDYKEIKVGNSTNSYKKKIVHGISENYGGHENNAYFMQIINPDRGKDIVLKYQINDKILPTLNDEEERERVAEMLGVTIDDLR